MQVWHPCVQWTRAYNHDVRIFRYPAPASEPIDHEYNYIDYKTAYRDSIHNVRHYKEQEAHTYQYYISDALSETGIQKLIRLKYLDKKNIDNEQEVLRAGQAYEKDHGKSYNQKVHKNEINDEEWDTLLSKNFSRESMAFFVREQFQGVKEFNKQLPITSDIEEFYKPQIEEIKHIDMFSNDPVFRQLIIDQHWIFRKISERNIQRGYQERFKGDPSFWKTLDNSFDSQTIKQIQGAIGDTVSNLDTKALDLQHNQQNYHKTDRFDFPIKTKFVE